jgi:hypothetical protein
LWTSKADPRKSRARLASDGPLKLVTSLAAAIAEIQQMVQPVLLERTIAAANNETESEVPALAAG